MSKQLTPRQRMEQRVKTCLETCACPCPDCAPKEIVKLMEAEHRRLRAKVRKLHQRYTTGIYGDSPVDYFVEDLLKAMR